MHAITRSSVLLLWIHTLICVQSQDCSLEEFLNSPLYDSNFDTSSLLPSYDAGKQVRVRCKVGYTGFFKLLCVEGKWLPRGDKCQRKSCGHPGDAEFADFQLQNEQDFVFGAQVVYTCHKGYQMFSRKNIRRCMAEGWDGNTPVCQAITCPVIPVDDNLYIYGNPEEATYGNVLRFRCKSNTKILSGQSEIYCDENGQWSAQPPTCKEIQCAVPVIENGYVPGDSIVYKENDVLHFLCNPKYIQSETRHSKCTKQGTGAEWIPTPACERITCKLQLPAIRGTRYDPVFRNVFSPGDRATVTCGDRYWISSPQNTSAEITCKDNGKWTIENPVCQEVRCHYRPDPHVTYWRDYWRQKTALGDTVGYQCIKNYKHTNNVQVATCTRDGWTPKPLCQEIVCNRLEIENAIVVVDSDKQIYKNHEHVEYICKTGFTGRFFITCGRNGWSRYPQCTAITCSSQNIPNAEIVGPPQNEYRYNDQVEYTCTNGYEGRFTLTCGETGLKGSPQCTKLCGKPKIDKAKITYNEKESYSQADKVEFTCTNNDEHFMVTCENGDWTGVKRCTEKCREIPEIPNGEVKSEDKIYEQDESVPVTCIEGYSAQVHKLTCHEGQWNSAGISYTTICTPLKCPPPPKLKNAVVLNLYQREYLSNTIITYQCRDHYTMEGENHIQCINGKWEEKNFMCTQYCDPLEPEEQTMEFAKDKERYMNGDVIKYQCIVSGVKIEGEATCVNGKWNKTEECKDSQSKSNPSTTDTAELGNIPLRNSDTDSVPQTISMV